MVSLEENKPAETKPMSSASETRILAALSYLSIVSVVMYVLKKDDEYIRFHARQGMVLFAASLLWIVPIVGWIVGMVAFVLALIGALKAYMGEKFKIPVVGDLAEKISF